MTSIPAAGLVDQAYLDLAYLGGGILIGLSIAAGIAAFALARGRSR